MKLSVNNVLIILYIIINGVLFIYCYGSNPMKKNIELNWIYMYTGIMCIIFVLQLFFPKKKTLLILALQIITSIWIILYFIF
jgi:hypothetical protein